MSDGVFLLWYVKAFEEGEDSELLIGVYRYEGDAQAAIERLKGKPGFRAAPAGFEYHRYELGKDHWKEGFILDASDLI